MKKILLILIAALIVSFGYTQKHNLEQDTTKASNTISVFPFIEEYECEGENGENFPPEGWTIFSLVDRTNWSDALNTFSHSGTNCAHYRHDLFTSDFMESQDAWLVSPQFEIPERGEFIFKFWHYVNFADDYVNGKSSVLISTSNEINATNNYTEVWTIETPERAWREVTFSLNEYKGQNIYIAFRFEQETWAHEWFVDDFSVEDLSSETYIVDKTPADNDTNIEVNAAVSATFNRDITASDLSRITITPNPGNVSASIAGRVLTIAHGDFDYGTEYTVTIPADAVENHTEPTTWSFTTKPKSNVNTLSASDILNIYPNPSKGEVNVKVTENSAVKITDIAGKIIRTFEIKEDEIINFTQAPGMYLINVKYDGKIYTQKLIIE